MTKDSTEAQRPLSYWEHNDPLAQILANVSGKARRQMIRDFWNAGAIDQLEEDQKGSNAKYKNLTTD
jgi:hypothetical protein